MKDTINTDGNCIIFLTRALSVSVNNVLLRYQNFFYYL